MYLLKFSGVRKLIWRIGIIPWLTGERIWIWILKFLHNWDYSFTRRIDEIYLDREIEILYLPYNDDAVSYNNEFEY